MPYIQNFPSKKIFIPTQQGTLNLALKNSLMQS